MSETYPKIPRQVPIYELRDWNSTLEKWGDTFGYYANNFWDKKSFADECDRNYPKNSEGAIPVEVKDVQHIYCVRDNKTSTIEFRGVPENTPGAIPMTIVLF